MKWQKYNPMMNKDTRYPLISVGNGYKDQKNEETRGFLLTRNKERYWESFFIWGSKHKNKKQVEKRMKRQKRRRWRGMADGMKKEKKKLLNLSAKESNVGNMVNEAWKTEMLKGRRTRIRNSHD